MYALYVVVGALAILAVCWVVVWLVRGVVALPKRHRVAVQRLHNLEKQETEAEKSYNDALRKDEIR